MGQISGGSPDTPRRYGLATFPAATDTRVGTVVPAGRALKISKITVLNNTAAAHTFNLHIASASSTATLLAYGMPLAPGETVEFDNLVAVAGESVMAACAVANGISVTVHGAEVNA